MPEKKKIAVIGSGNWGSAVARHVARNVAADGALRRHYRKQVDMWVYEENLKDGRKLTEVINTDHVNVKYLPQVSLPPNLVASPSLADVVRGAAVLILVPPHQFVRRISRQISGMLTPRQRKEIVCVSLAKGIEFDKKEKLIRRMSQVFQDETGVKSSQLAALSGANIAGEVASDMYAETTIAAPSVKVREELYRIFHTDNFVVELTGDIAGVELGGALKNVVAVAAGMVDGLGFGNNTKAAVVRAGLVEMIKFGSFKELGHPAGKETFLGAAGLGDLITTCFGGRNRMFGEELGKLYLKDPKEAMSVSIEELEWRLLQGQKIQGVDTAAEVHTVLREFGLLDEFPVFTSVYNICFRKKDPRSLYRRFVGKETEVVELTRFLREEIVPYAGSLSVKYGVKYRIGAPPAGEALAAINPALLKTVVKRILSKAFRHTKRGGCAALSVRVSAEELVVNVRNAGKGIAGSQMDAAHGKMAHTAQIVERHGGNFYIKSRGEIVDMGFRLPRA